MATNDSELFVTPDWLAAHLGDPGVIAVEAGFYLPDEGKDADALFREAHIPGAVRFDVDKIADASIPLPHMLPDAATFGAMVGQLGISETMTVVVYDATDLLGGARAWWMLKHYGARDVRLLAGGLAAWRAADLPTESGAATRAPASFKARFDAATVVDAERVLAASTSGSSQIVDARAAPRFAGAVPEPRPGLRSGHIPGSRNVPWKAIVAAAGIDVERPIIASCGSGVSAAVLILGLEQLGRTGVRLYDGSWSEWGGRADLPLETGPAK